MAKTSRIRIYDRTGALIKELRAMAFREWVINDIGTASFTIKSRGMERFIEFGNYVTIEHEKLDTWVGVIVTPRPFDANKITVNCKSAMWLFDQRAGSNAQPVNGSWSQVFTQILSLVNAPESTLLQIGTRISGINYDSVVDLTNVYTYLQRALAQSQSRLDFRTAIIKGSLSIFIDMVPALYTESPLQLIEGLNVKDQPSMLIQQGEIYNDITVMGVGLDQEKFTARVRDQNSISRYGLRQKVFAEGQSQADVDRLATVRLAQYATPRTTMALGALDVGNTWLLTRIGNIGTVELNTRGYFNGNLGFRGNAYIKVIQYDDSTKEATLVCEEQ